MSDKKSHISELSDQDIISVDSKAQQPDCIFSQSKSIGDADQNSQQRESSRQKEDNIIELIM